MNSGYLEQEKLRYPPQEISVDEFFPKYIKKASSFYKDGFEDGQKSFLKLIEKEIKAGENAKRNQEKERYLTNVNKLFQGILTQIKSFHQMKIEYSDIYIKQFNDYTFEVLILLDSDIFCSTAKMNKIYNHSYKISDNITIIEFEFQYMAKYSHTNIKLLRSDGYVKVLPSTK